MKKLFWKVRFIVMGVNLFIAGLFVWLGWLMDKKYGTGVAFTFAAVAVSFPIAQWVVYKLVKKLV